MARDLPSLHSIEKEAELGLEPEPPSPFQSLATAPPSREGHGQGGRCAMPLRPGGRGSVPRVKISQSRIPKDHTSLRVV